MYIILIILAYICMIFNFNNILYVDNHPFMSFLIFTTNTEETINKVQYIIYTVTIRIMNAFLFVLFKLHSFANIDALTLPCNNF